MELKGKKINFLGDSITQGVGTSSPEHMYMNVLKEECGLREVKIYGISGTRISRQPIVNPQDPFDNDFNMRAPLMDDDADCVVVFGGTNDYGHGKAPLGCMDDRDVHTFYGAVHTLVRTLIKKYMGKQIVFMTPLHRFNEVNDWSGKDEGVDYKPLIYYVKAIREVCEYYSIPVLDLYKESGINASIPEYREIYIPDGLHPSDEGNKIIAHKLRKFLENL